MDLAPYAMDVRDTRGRRHPEPPHPYRNDYARDRDRIVHSRAFRRMEAKTQVFTTRYSDHFRNRLTHTLEVVQIARTVAGALNLNTDLAEALALVHDIGHPPFGHAGEKKLDELLRQYGDHFNHNLHALHIVEKFEQRYLAFRGLNLTFEVREGIIKHSRDYSAAQFPDLAEYLLDQRPPLEAQLIDLVDEIAYNTADLDDAFEARLVSIEDVSAGVPLFGKFYQEIDAEFPQGRRKLKFNEALKRVLNYLVTDLIHCTRTNVANAGVKSIDDIRQNSRRLAAFSESAAAANMQLKRFLFSHLYENPAIVEDRDRSVGALQHLFLYYIERPEAMPPFYAEEAKTNPRQRVVCDYIAGMTDHFLLETNRELAAKSGPTSAAD
jgi:dGTPase